MKKWQIALLLTAVLVILGMGIILGLNANLTGNDEEPWRVLEADLQQHGETLEELIHRYQGEWVDRKHRGFREFDRILGLKLEYVDLRNLECGRLYFEFMLEGSMTLCYCPEDQYVVDATHVVTAESGPVRLENLGMGGKGYLLCRRLGENWFYVEAYLPT